MSLFQCYQCGCRENTATSNFWSRMPAGGWRGKPSEAWALCSACDPAIGEWHEVFPRVYLPKHEFVTDERGNLAHVDTGLPPRPDQCSEVPQ